MDSFPFNPVGFGSRLSLLSSEFHEKGSLNHFFKEFTWNL